MFKKEIDYIKQSYGNNITIQMDNASAHTSAKTTKYFNDNRINTLSWPAQSPDLNIIESCWSRLKYKISEKKIPKNKTELKKLIRQCWRDISSDYIIKLYASMKRRCQEVINNNGYSTKY